MGDYQPDARLKRPEGDFVLHQVVAGSVAIRKAPQPSSEMLTQALSGEGLRLFRQEDGFGLVQSEADGYVGWASLAALAEPVMAPTHRISALAAHAFSEPSIKSAPAARLSLNAWIASEGDEGRFRKAARLGHVVAIHTADPHEYDDDPAGVALRFADTPYLWGGKESAGLDCSGLTQMAFAACGVTLPRDTDMQAAWAGELLADREERNTLRRGDLVYWKGHVGLMLDAARMVHANAFHMKVSVENLSAARARIDAEYGPPVAVRRVDVEAESGRVPDWLTAALDGPF